MNYAEVINWLFKIPLSFNRNYNNYNLKLEPVIKLCDHLGNPQNNLKIIHVGGTNGKGSTCHLLASVLQQSATSDSASDASDTAAAAAASDCSAVGVGTVVVLVVSNHKL